MDKNVSNLKKHVCTNCEGYTHGFKTLDLIKLQYSQSLYLYSCERIKLYGKTSSYLLHVSVALGS